MSVSLNRRRFERFALPPMYTAVIVKPVDGEGAGLVGHAYDISEAGIRFELDQPLPAGTQVVIAIELPVGAAPRPERIVSVIANVIWVSEDPDEPGPARMAAAFTRFARASDRERLLGALSSGRFARAA